jgi:hypothetical protein
VMVTWFVTSSIALFSTSTIDMFWHRDLLNPLQSSLDTDPRQSLAIAGTECYVSAASTCLQSVRLAADLLLLSLDRRYGIGINSFLVRYVPTITSCSAVSSNFLDYLEMAATLRRHMHLLTPSFPGAFSYSKGLSKYLSRKILSDSGISYYYYPAPKRVPVGSTQLGA